MKNQMLFFFFIPTTTFLSLHILSEIIHKLFTQICLVTVGTQDISQYVY